MSIHHWTIRRPAFAAAVLALLAACTRAADPAPRQPGVADTAHATPAELTLPFPSAADLQRFEGVLVRLPQTLYVTEHYQLGRYNEIVLSSGAPQMAATAVAAPGADARALDAANQLNRITIDDTSYVQNPATVFGRNGAPLSAGNTLRVGDTVTGLTGILTRTSAAGTGAATWRIRVTGVPRFSAANARPDTPPAVGGTLRVASFNVLNYFNTFAQCTGGAGGAQTNCRGADNEAEFERQWPKTVAALAALDADIIAIVEVENDGYGAHSALAHLTDRLNAATSPGRYAFIDVDAATGVVNALGTDAIKVALLYRQSRVRPTGRTAALNSQAFQNAGDAEPRNRPSLAQAFEHADGGRLIVSVNHFKSKGSPCDAPDARDGQGNCNAVRTRAASLLLDWLATDPTGTAEPRVLVMGDLNAYAREDPIRTFTQRGFTDLLARYAGEHAYTYIFNGQRGYLDHALAASALLPHVTGAAVWHINADEPPVLDYNTNFKSIAQQQSLYRADPYRSADHDPVLVGLRLR